jgi:hypothetical protein
MLQKQFTSYNHISSIELTDFDSMTWHSQKNYDMCPI